MYHAVFVLGGLWLCLAVTPAATQEEPKMTAPWPPLEDVDPMVQNGLGTSPYKSYKLSSYTSKTGRSEFTYVFRSDVAIALLDVFVRVDFYRGYGLTKDGHCEDIGHIIVRHAICEHGTYDVLVGLGNDEEYPCLDRSPTELEYRVVPQESTTFILDRMTKACDTIYAFTGKFYTEHSEFQKKMYDTVTLEVLQRYRPEEVLIRLLDLLHKPAEVK